LEDILNLLIPQDEPEGTVNKIKEGKTFKTNFALTVGPVDEPQSGFLLHYERDQTAATIRKAAKVEDPVVLSFCFVVKDDVDPFSLGELSGSVKNILGLGSFLAKVKYQVKSAMNTETDGTRTFVLSLTSSDPTIVDVCKKVLDYYSPNKFEVGLDLSQSPTGEYGENDFIAAKLRLETDTKRDAVRLLENLIMQGQGMTEADYKVVQLIRAMRNFGLELEFDNIKDFYNFTVNNVESDPLEFRILSWKTLKFGIERGLEQYLVQQGGPLPAQVKAPLSELYKRLCDYLKAIHSVKFCAEGHALVLDFKTMNIFEALPKLDAIEAKLTGNSN